MKTILSKLKNAIFIDLIRKIIAVILNTPEVANALATRLTPMQDKKDELDKAFGPSNVELTKNVSEADKARDNCFKSFKYGLKHYQLHHDATLKSAGTDILELVDRHIPSLSQLDYLSQTQIMIEMFNELDQLESEKGHLNTLGLLDQVNQMKVYNTNFDTVYIERVNEINKSKGDSVTTQRSEATDLLLNLIKGLDSLIDAGILSQSDTTAYQNVRNDIQKMIDDLGQYYVNG